MIAECDACHFTTKVKEYDPPAMGKRTEKYKFCDVCANTSLSNICMYNHLSDYQPLAQSIGYCTNLILKEFKKLCRNS